MAQSIDTLRAYVRDAELFKDHVGTGLLWASATEARAPGTTCVSPRRDVVKKGMSERGALNSSLK
jgi:hypothetical protein